MTGDPDLGSPRTDAGLITCQVHNHATRAVLTSAIALPARAVESGHPGRSSLRPTSYADTPLAGRG